MQLVEGIDRRKLWTIVALGIPLCCAFGCVWSTAKGDVQGAFTISGFLVSAMALFVAAASLM